MEVNRGKLMWASFLTLIAAGMGFAVRGGLLVIWGKKFGFTQFELGTITGGGLAGFGIVILIASLVTDRVGYKAILTLAMVLHILSLIITLGASPAYAAMGRDGAYWFLYMGVFVFAVANGLCETAINPLIANIYPERKTHYLNILHAGWPAGLVVGGLLGLIFVSDNIPWEIPLALYGLPTIWYGYIIIKEPFPDSDVKKAGISFGDMMKEFVSPVLLFLLILHAGVGYVELGTDSWITNITNSILTGQGFYLFIYTSLLMTALRFFAGPIVEKINPLGLLCVSTVLGTVGLLMLGSVEGAAMVWIAVTIYGLGKTFLWPTMLGIVGERFPRGGAVTMGAIGGAGALSAGFLGGPLIGYKQDVAATSYVQEKSEDTYGRYKKADENKVLLGLLPSIQGLDGQKVGTLLDGGKGAKDEAERFKENEAVQEHYKWWTEVGKPNEAKDKETIGPARTYGARKALIWTAAVPAGMCIGYLLLVFYFASQGGYKEVDLKDEEEKT